MSSAAEQHIVGLQGDKNLERFANDGREFKKIRVVVHAVSVAPSGLTENLVSVYLLIRNTEHSVRINMRSDLDNDDIRGFLVWSRHDYNTSNSRLVQKDYLGIPETDTTGTLPAFLVGGILLQTSTWELCTRWTAHIIVAWLGLV